MPLTKKGRKIKRAMQQQYGSEKGESVFYASINAGKVHGAERKGALHDQLAKRGKSRR